MINENDVYTPLTDNEAQIIVLQIASDLGIEVPEGSAEEQISFLLTQWLLAIDNNIGKSYALQMQPVGSEIDLQNPGNPRLTAGPSSGYLRIFNPTVSPITVGINKIATAPNGLQYTTGNNTVTVQPSAFANIPVASVESGISQNQPSNQDFTFADYPDLEAVNPQPFTDGRDAETDTQYLSRLIYLKTNYTSEQASPAAVKELLQFYRAARIYVNDSANDILTPIPKPATGYTAIVLTPSGAAAEAAEIYNALLILSRRFEFKNAYKISTATHPVLSGTIYTAQVPQIFYFIPAQAVDTVLTATLQVKFSDNVDSAEKLAQATAFAKFFVQNVFNFLGGSSGSAHVSFQAVSEYSPTDTTVPIVAAKGIVDNIAPEFSIEQIRALISDEEFLTQIRFMSYVGCSALRMEMDSMVPYESMFVLDIDDPYAETYADFKKNVLFSDNTSWFDRYIYLDPDKITVNVVEVP